MDSVLGAAPLFDVRISCASRSGIQTVTYAFCRRESLGASQLLPLVLLAGCASGAGACLVDSDA